MDQFRIERCTRCGASGVAIEVMKKVEAGYDVTNMYTIYEYFGVCGLCRQGLIVGCFDYGGNEGLEYILPEINNGIPEHLPENVRKFFVQGVDNLHQKNFDAAGLMFRKALEVALKRIIPDHNQCSLHKLIKKAASSGNLTSELAEWADEIRILGNSAAHEDNPFSMDEAQQVSEFAKLVLNYVVTLPEKLRAAREKRGRDGNSP